MASLYNPIRQLNCAYLIYGIIYLVGAIYAVPLAESGLDKILVGFMFLNVTIISIAYLIGKGALQTKEPEDWRCFSLLIIAGLFMQMATGFIALMNSHSFGFFIMHSFVAGFLTAVIFGFQLMMAILAVQLNFEQQFV